MLQMGPAQEEPLFGGDRKWDASDWKDSDDRVRGGKSQSYLDLSASGSIATFHGVLDIKTLGGAGFASQRTTGEDRKWNLSDYDGIELGVEKADAKSYTFILKDSLLPPDPENSREQSTISYEYDFKIDATSLIEDSNKTIFIAWDDFTATYRGKKKDDAPKLDLHNIKRISLMNRSFFGTQEGKFSLSLKSIKAVMQPQSPSRSSTTTGTEIDLYREYEKSKQKEEDSIAAQKTELNNAKPQGLFHRLLHLCNSKY